VKQLLQADGLAALALQRAVRDFSLKHSFSGLTVLDVGCGTMPYRPIFTTLGANYLGADIDGAPDILIGSDGALPLADESVEFAVSFQVLEHVRDVPRYLASIRKVLKTGGSMFLSTHGVWPYHPHPTDYWRWTRDGLLLTLERGGFRIQSMSALCGPAAWVPMFPLLACKSALGGFWPVLAPVNLAINLIACAADHVTPTTIRENNAAIFAVEALKPA
jgi:SAM-dependent methyltransferase